MSIKDSISKHLALGGVALASAGLTTCSNQGAVDPAPPPLDCRALGGGQPLDVQAALIGGDVMQLLVATRSIPYAPPPKFDTLAASDLVGATLLTIDRSVIPARIELRLAAPDGGAAGPRTGSLTITGTVTAADGDVCNVGRRLTFTVHPAGSVVIARRDPLPLPVRHAAEIALLRREGKELLLAAKSRYPGPQRVEWAVTHGETSATGERGLLWRLPEAPGLYQVELTIDYGEDGLAFDTLTFEVT